MTIEIRCHHCDATCQAPASRDERTAALAAIGWLRTEKITGRHHHKVSILCPQCRAERAA